MDVKWHQLLIWPMSDEPGFVLQECGMQGLSIKGTTEHVERSGGSEQAVVQERGVFETGGWGVVGG